MRATPDEAFTEAYRSHRIEAGDDPSTLPAAPAATRKQLKSQQRPSEDPVRDGGEAESEDLGGGFIVEDDADDAGAGGGFIPESGSEGDIDEGGGSMPEAGSSADGSPTPSSLPKYLPITEVPHALSILSLPAQDEGILAVFKSAAIDDPRSAPASSSSSRKRIQGGTGATTLRVISRDDFKQVCEVLLADNEDSQSNAYEAQPPEPTTSKRTPSKRLRSASPPVESSASRRPTRLAAARQRRAAKAQLYDVGSDVASSADEDEYRDSDAGDPAGRSGVLSDEADSDEGQNRSKRLGRGASSKRSHGRSSGGKSRSVVSESQAEDTDDNRRRRRRPARKGQTTAESDEDGNGEDDSAAHAITEEQRATAHGAWNLFADKLQEVYPEWDGERIGKREIQRLAISVGEKISDKEVSAIHSSLAVVQCFSFLTRAKLAAQIDEMLKLGFASFAPASSKYATREASQAARLRNARQGGTEGVGLDEFAGILITGRMI